MQACALSQVSSDQTVLHQLKKPLKATRSTACFFGKSVALHLVNIYISLCRIEGVVVGSAGAVAGGVIGAVGGGAVKLVKHCLGQESKPLEHYAIKTAQVGYRLGRILGVLDGAIFSLATLPVTLPFAAILSAVSAGVQAPFVFADHMSHPGSGSGSGSGLDTNLLKCTSCTSDIINDAENEFLNWNVMDSR